MRKLLIPAFLVICVLLMSATAQPVSAGTEPSQFKINPILNRANAARNQLESIDNRLEHMLEKSQIEIEHTVIKGYIARLRAMESLGHCSLGTIVSTQSMFYQGELTEDQGNDYAESLGGILEVADGIINEVDSHLRSHPDLEPEFRVALIEFQKKVLVIVELVHQYLAEVDDDDPER